MTRGSAANLRAMFARADAIDRAEGLLAYSRYHAVMQDLARTYNLPLERVTAAFVSLSPNSDYIGNLRSTLSVLDAVVHGYPIETVTVATYGHCKLRAYTYATGAAEFESRTRGLKVLSFYHNLLRPLDPEWVTVDGHVCAAWQGLNLTMKEAMLKGRREYYTIRDAITELAGEAGILPNQWQATLWFTRKRVLRSKYNPQLSLFHGADDTWRTAQVIADLKPYKRAQLGDPNVKG